MTLKQGRFFSEDEHAQNRRVVIVNEKLARLVWPDQDPVGKRLKWGGGASQAPWLTIVGVIRECRRRADRRRTGGPRVRAVPAAS